MTPDELEAFAAQGFVTDTEYAAILHSVLDHTSRCLMQQESTIDEDIQVLWQRALETKRTVKAINGEAAAKRDRARRDDF